MNARGVGIEQALLVRVAQRHRFRSVACVVLSLAMALAGVSPAVVGQDDLDRDSLGAATVLVSPDRFDPSQSWWGSGSIVDEDGLILTNAHVAANRAPGVAVLYPDVRYEPPSPQTLYIYTVNSIRDRAQPTYQAEVAAVDGYLDLAVLRIVAHADGVPLAPDELELTPVPLGTAAELRPLDELFVAGYPDIADTFAVRFSRGELHNFADDPLVGRDAWLHTDAKISGGNSGGLAVDVTGRLVAVPTQTTSEGAFGAVDFNMRPIDLALPLIEAARSGAPYDEYTHVVRPSGAEVARVIGWSDLPTNDCEVGGDLIAYGSEAAVPHVEFAGMERGDHVLVELVEFGAGGGRNVVGFQAFDWDEALGESACLPIPLYYDRALPSGDYSRFLSGEFGVAVRIGPQGEVEAAAPSQTAAARVQDPFADLDVDAPELDQAVPTLRPARPRSTPTNREIRQTLLARYRPYLNRAARGRCVDWFRRNEEGTWNPFTNTTPGAMAAIICRRPAAAAARMAIYQFPSIESLAAYWSLRVAGVEDAVGGLRFSVDACTDNRRGTGRDSVIEYVCYRDRAGVPRLKWINQRDLTYGIADGASADVSLRRLFTWWRNNTP